MWVYMKHVTMHQVVVGLEDKKSMLSFFLSQPLVLLKPTLLQGR